MINDQIVSLNFIFSQMWSHDSLDSQCTYEIFFYYPKYCLLCAWTVHRFNIFRRLKPSSMMKYLWKTIWTLIFISEIFLTPQTSAYKSKFKVTLWSLIIYNMLQSLQTFIVIWKFWMWYYIRCHQCKKSYLFLVIPCSSPMSDFKKTIYGKN